MAVCPGYYIHRALKPDPASQFEGGLPTFNFQGSEEIGVGDASVVADPPASFLMADVRFGSTAGIGLFRASAGNLLNLTDCCRTVGIPRRRLDRAR